MDKLTESLELLHPSEEKDFRLFLQRTSLRKDTQILTLFRSIQKGEVKRGKAGMRTLYEIDNMNAYHSVRKRLLRQLHRYLVIRRIETDQTDAASIMGLITVAGFYIERSAFELASGVLEQAREKAEKSARFDLLDNIYYQQIQYAQELGLDVQQISMRWQQNKKQSLLAEKISIAHAIMRKKLQEARLRGAVLNIEDMTHEVLIDFELEDESQHNVSFMYGICSLIRSAIISSKNYVHFATFVSRQYRRLQRDGALERSSPLVVLGFQYMVAHAYYRNRRWVEAISVLEEMETIIGSKSGQQIRQYFPRYILLKAAVFSYTGENKVAVKMLTDALKQSGTRLSLSDKLNMQINLAVYHFQAESYGKSATTLLSLNHSDVWLEKKMGKEWRMKKNLIEVIVQCELGNIEWALQKIKLIEKHFAEFLDQPFYQRARIFMGFIRELISDPNAISKPEFAKKVDEANLALPGDREDIQAITFFCWLKSKMVKRPYYEVLLEIVKD